MDRYEMNDYVKDKPEGFTVDLWLVSVMPSQNISMKRPLSQNQKPQKVRMTRYDYPGFRLERLDLNGNPYVPAKHISDYNAHTFFTEQEAWVGYEAQINSAYETLVNRIHEYSAACNDVVDKARKIIRKNKK